MFAINSTQPSVQFPGVPKPSPEKKGNPNHEIFKNAIAGTASPETASTKNLSEHSVTIHTGLNTDSSEAASKENCSEITAKKKKKKKKKKTPSAQQKQVAAALIGQAAFGLTPMPPPPSIEKNSIYNDPCFSSFKEGEKKILNEMLAGNIFFDSSNLLEVFMGDLHRHSEKLMDISKGQSFSLLLHDSATKTFYSNISNNVLAIFSFEMILLKEKARNGERPPAVPLQNFIKKFINESGDSLKKRLESYVKEHFLNKGKEFPTIVKQYTECLNSYEEKLNLLCKCLMTKNMEKICLLTKTNSWIEAAQTTISNPKILSQKYLQLSTFVKHVFEIFTQLKKVPEIKNLVIQYLDSITQIVSGNISKSSLNSFLHTYKQYALGTTEEIIFLKSLFQDPKILINHLTENPHLVINKFKLVDIDKLEMLKFDYDMQYYSLLTVDKWMSDLHEAICFEFCEKFNELGINSLQSHLERLLAMMHIARNDLEEINKVKADENLSDVFLIEIQETIQKLTPEIEKEFHHSNNLKEWIESDESLLVLSKLNKKLQKKPFQLTKCLLQSPKDMKKTISGGQVKALITQMKQAIFDIVKKAKNNSSKDWNPSDFKKKIQKILIDETAELCVYLMIMAEVNNFFEEDHSKGFTQILPDEIVSLLDLTDLEEIFAKPSVSNSDNQFSVTSQSEDSFRPLEELAAESPKSNEPEILEKPKKKEAVSSATTLHPKTTKAPKEIEMPTRQDFKEATNKRVFHRLLTKLGFTPSTHGKHPGYEKNGFRIPVPHSVEAEGTRMSIYEQATRAGHLESKRN